MRRRTSPSSATCCRQSVVEIMWCVFFATIPTCSCFLCSGCGETSLWTSATCGWSGTQHQPDVHEAISSKCLQLLGMHALTGGETTSFPFNKGKVSALSVLEAGYLPGVFHVLGEGDAMQWGLLEIGLSFFCALYGRKPDTPMEEARYNLYTKTKAMPRLRNIPPNTSTNLLLHVQRAHPQMPLWKGADQHSPPDIDVSNFGWEMKADVPSPCIDPGPTWPPALMDVISCRCRAAGKACAAICTCKKECLSCTIYCLYQS